MLGRLLFPWMLAQSWEMKLKGEVDEKQAKRRKPRSKKKTVTKAQASPPTKRTKKPRTRAKPKTTKKPTKKRTTKKRTTKKRTTKKRTPATVRPQPQPRIPGMP